MRAAERRLALVGLLAMLLAGCVDPTPRPLATLQAVRVQVTPAARSLLPTLQDCAERLEGAGLVVDELPASATDVQKADLVFRLGLPGGYQGFSAQVGAEDLVVAANPDNPASSISLADLQAIFGGKTNRWPGRVDEVEVWSYPGGDDLAEAFQALAMGNEAISSRAALAPFPQAMRESIAASPSAIGYLPGSLVDASVKQIKIEGSPTWQAPLLALAAAEPRGAARQLAACMQKAGKS